MTPNSSIGQTGRGKLPAVLAVVLLLLAACAFADGFDTFGKQDDLKKTVIVDVGEAEKIDPPRGKLGAREVIKLAGKCFEPSDYLGYWGYGKKAALLLVDQSRIVKIALLENGSGSIKVDVIRVTRVDCAAITGSDLPIDPQKTLELLRQKQDEFDAFQRENERLKSERAKTLELLRQKQDALQKELERLKSKE